MKGQCVAASLCFGRPPNVLQHVLLVVSLLDVLARPIPGLFFFVFNLQFFDEGGRLCCTEITARKRRANSMSHIRHCRPDRIQFRHERRLVPDVDGSGVLQAITLIERDVSKRLARPKTSSRSRDVRNLVLARKFWRFNSFLNVFVVFT